MSSMDEVEVALNGFGHLYFLLAGEGSVVFQIRNKMRPMDRRKRRSPKLIS